jgi:polysaccharide biosynthesis/export protein
MATATDITQMKAQGKSKMPTKPQFSRSSMYTALATLLVAASTCVAQESTTANTGQVASGSEVRAEAVQPAPPASSNLPLASASAAPAVRVDAGDLIEVDVFDTPELSGKLRVNERGEIELPIAGTLNVQGKTADGVARAVEEKLKSASIMHEPHVNVMVLEYVTQGATVFGEVSHPGVYPVMGRQTLSDLISASGGLLPTAGVDIAITHKNEPSNPVRVTFDKRNPSVTGSQVILPGDTVVVSRGGVVYVVGAVGRQGGYILTQNDEKMTVLQALALAEGAKPDAQLKKAKLLRTTERGREEISVDVKSILANKSPDMTLQRDDILFVPTSAIKSHALQSAQLALSVATGVALYAR